MSYRLSPGARGGCEPAEKTDGQGSFAAVCQKSAEARSRKPAAESQRQHDRKLESKAYGTDDADLRTAPKPAERRFRGRGDINHCVDGNEPSQGRGLDGVWRRRAIDGGQYKIRTQQQDQEIWEENHEAEPRITHRDEAGAHADGRCARYGGCDQVAQAEYHRMCSTKQVGDSLETRGLDGSIPGGQAPRHHLGG